jgi:phosphoesterase RecJ-like protein
VIPEIDRIKKIIEESRNILIIQADNPDGDSLASALALEQIFGDMDKNPMLYCSVDMPGYLKFIKGWDRVSKLIPHKVDSSLIVDTSSNLLLSQLDSDHDKAFVVSKPVIVLDHHENVKCDISYATAICNAPSFVSTGELIYEIAKNLNWPLKLPALENLTQSILSDSLGLISEGATAETYRRVAEMIDKGVSRAKLEETRRELSKMHQSVFKYKADLIKRTEFYGDNNEIAIVVIPEDELYTVGTLYNPAPLIINEMTMVEDVKVGIALKVYQNRVTGSIRCIDGINIAHDIAESFGGGGHPYAAGFKIEKPNIDVCDLKCQVINKAKELLK